MYQEQSSSVGSVPRGALRAGARPTGRGEAATDHAPLAAAVACAAQGSSDEGGGVVLPAPVLLAHIPCAVVAGCVIAVAFDAGARRQAQRFRSQVSGATATRAAKVGGREVRGVKTTTKQAGIGVIVSCPALVPATRVAAGVSPRT